MDRAPCRVTPRFLALMLVALVLALSACHAPGSPPLRHVLLSSCHVKGIETDLRCGTLLVPENRDDKSAKAQVPLWFALRPAVSRSDVLDPVFIIAGGPGQSASSVAGQLMPLFMRLNRNRDIVFLDQRGTGHSQALNCAPPKDADGLAAQLDPKLILDSLGECAAKFKARGIDVTHYLTVDAVADLDQVRAALGYQKINLWSASYGTRVALEFVREHPQNVRSVVLDGAAPSSLKIPIALSIDADQSLNTVLARCAKDQQCAKSHPNETQKVDELFARLEHGPIEAKIHDPLTGVETQVSIDRDTFSAWLRQPLYTALTAGIVPEAIDRAAAGDFDPLAALNLSVAGDALDELSLGMHLSVICSEDMAHITPQDLASVQASRFGTSFYTLYQSMCQRWSERALPSSFYAPIMSDIPILIFAGGLDPATPARHALALLPTLSNARLIVAPNLGHGASGQACAPDLIDEFIRSADAKKLDASCLEHLPAEPFFFVPTPGRNG